MLPALLTGGRTLLPAAGRFVLGNAARAGAGIGTGYTASDFTNQQYATEDALIDGALGILGFRRGPMIGGRAGTSILGRGINRATSWPVRVGALGMIPFSDGSDAHSSPSPVQMPDPSRTSNGPLQGPVLQHQGASLARVNPVQIDYTPGTAPSFNKTLKDYLADRQLQGLVNMQIFQTNKPLLDTIRQAQVQRSRDLTQNKQLGASLQKKYVKKIEDQAADHAAAQARADVRQQVLAAETAQAESQVPITYTDGENAVAKSQATESSANERGLADALIDRLAADGKAYLEQLRNADEQQTEVDAHRITRDAQDNIRQNVNQVRANQAQRGTLLGTLAAEQLRNDIDLFNTRITQYNNDEQRRYQQAESEANLAYQAAAENAKNEAALAASGGEVKEDPKTEAARKRYDKLNDKISMLKGKPSKRRPDRLYIKEEGRKEFQALRAERDRIAKKYGF